MAYIILLPLFFGVMVLYFRLADRYNIIDKPNQRSSHRTITIRGGGIVFLFAALIELIMHVEYALPLLGIFVIGTISFLDDVITLSNKIRIFFHLVSVTLLFIFLKVFNFLPFYYSISLYVLVIGIINAYNFMDGINGITGIYSLVILAGLQYINLWQTKFIHPDMIWLPIMTCVVFLYYNFRVKAKCFAGDVGSVSIAFWITFLLLDLIFTTNKWSYIFFMSVYGVDSILTIIHRIVLKQNIFKAHRLHFYQLLANECSVPHRVVSVLYAVIQLAIIIIVIHFNQLCFPILFITTVLPLAILYVVIKPKLIANHKNKSMA